MFCWHDKSWESLLYEGWNQAFGASIHKEWAASGKPLAETPPGSHPVEPFRIALYVPGREWVIKAQAFMDEKIRKYNEDVLRRKRKGT